MTKRKGPLPAEVRRHLDVFEDALRRAAEGAPTPEVLDDLGRAADVAAQSALHAGQTKSTVSFKDRTVTFAALIADKLRKRRDEAGWTQTQLAEAMRDLGFDWKRITVAEVERRSEDDAEKAPRRVSLEELFALAALYGLPLVHFVMPEDGDYIVLPGPQGIGRRAIDPGTAGALILGQQGVYGTGGAEWETAKKVALVGPKSGRRDRRPAVDLWQRRHLGYGRGLRQREES